jgi:hypothetical protein
MAQYTIPLMMASTAISLYSQRTAANAQRAQTRQAATAARLEAQGEQIERRRRLLATLAAQNNAAGSSGLTPNESFTNMQQNDLAMYDLDIARAEAEASGTRRAYQLQQASTTAQANAGMASTVASAGYRYSLMA